MARILTALQRSLVAVVGLAALAGAAQLCNLSLANCPEFFDGDTVVVPQHVIALSASVHACKSDSVLGGNGTSGSVPSIVFVIDNSGSMTGTGGTAGNDEMGSRFSVTKAFLDTIYKKQPNAEVSVVVFTDHLYFDPTTTDYFSQYFVRFTQTVDTTPDQAYLKFIKLDQLYGTKRGIDVIKDVLATDTVPATGNTNEYVTLHYKPNFAIGNSTNINGAFLAVRQSFATAANPKSNQFMIFFSDGNPQGNTQAGMPIDSFEAGADLPTTFTVFFTPNNAAPQTLTNMTQNIQNNGYSQTNPKSNLWAIQTNYNALLQLLLTNVLPTILVGGAPVSMNVNGTVSTRYVNSAFVFADSFPLNDSITHFKVEVAYQYTNKTTGLPTDTVDTTDFYVKRSDNLAPSSGVSLSCWNYTIPLVAIPVTATLLDTSGDGHLDRIDFTWTDTAAILASPPTADQLIAALGITTLGGQPVSLHAVDIRWNIAGKSAQIVLRENTGSPLETGWSGAVVSFAQIPVSVSGLRYFVCTKVLDGAGPVIDRAVYYPEALDTSSSAWDTIALTMSEPVRCSELMAQQPQNEFTYYDSTGAVETTALQNAHFVPATCTSDPTTTFTLVVSRASVHPAPLKDRIQLIGGTHDTASNAPPVNGRLAVIEWGGTGGIKIAAGPNNPFIPGVTVIPPEVVSFYSGVFAPGSSPASQKGVIVGVQTKLPLAETAPGQYGSALIFDALGNVVAKNLVVKGSQSARDYGVFWDGRNTNGRYVGNGAYLLILSVKDVNGLAQSSKIKIGVKR